jgi:hypothetical protein
LPIKNGRALNFYHKAHCGYPKVSFFSLNAS